MQYLEEEGFDATYFPRGDGGKGYRDKLAHLPDDLELGESFAIMGMYIQFRDTRQDSPGLR